MAFASTAVPGPAIRLPHVKLPKLRWPRLSGGTRAWLMIALMFSPCVLSDAFGYCVQRIFYTEDQLAARQSPETMMAKISMFDVACPTPNTPPAERDRWDAYAAEQGWPLYPQAGPGCFHPDRNLRGVLPLKVFTVACPKVLLSAVESRRWLVFAADHGWTAYQQAGDGCVDP